VLPGTMAVRKLEKKAKLIQYAERVWGIHGQDDDTVIQQAIDKTIAFFESLGFATHLSAYNIKEEQIPDIAATLLKHGMTGIGEHGSVTLDVCEEILHKAL